MGQVNLFLKEYYRCKAMMSRDDRYGSLGGKNKDTGCFHIGSAPFRVVAWHIPDTVIDQICLLSGQKWKDCGWEGGVPVCTKQWDDLKTHKSRPLSSKTV